MPSKYPVLGETAKRSHTASALLLLLLGAGGASLVWWWKDRHERQVRASSAPVAEESKPPAAHLQPAPPPGQEAVRRTGVQLVSVSIDGTLERALVAATSKELGQALAQVVTRTLVWWVSVPSDFRRTDKLEVLFEERVGEEPLLSALRFSSSKLARTFRAYRFKAAGSEFARFYDPSGEEIELRLQDPPLDDYEQVTSLVKDGRGHKGVDFKTPLNSKVRATFDGTITRKNWNFHGNGNSLEITEAAGQSRKALFLHLSELPKSVQLGKRVSKGEVLAGSGNTGHSFAPHLHYQLMKNDRVIDPFASHQTYRRRLGAESQPALAAEIVRLDGLMATALAGK
jgi:murein DD-endopeptidase